MNVRGMEADSAYTISLPEGCKHCREGSKMVLLVTGRCRGTCYYCPLSGEKKGKDVTYANEMRVKDERDVIEEARSIGATGTGITGGDPLAVLDRTIGHIRLLKGEFGEMHHIHLYTCTIDPDAVRRLEEAGLDEIRFHPPTEDWEEVLSSALPAIVARTKMDIGLEVPVIPGMKKELVALILSAEEMGMDFVNLNELEFSETNWERLRERGFGVKDEVSAAVTGSEELALELLEMGFDIPLHYCSASFKDAVQLRRRLIRRAERTASESDVITEDGTLLKGIIECEDPVGMMRLLGEEYEVPAELMRLDLEKERLEVAPWILEELAEELDCDSFIVEEYPTADRLEVEREPLRRR